MDISKIARHAGQLLKRNSSTILTGLGVAGSMGSMVLAVKATPGAVRKLQDYADRMEEEFQAGGDEPHLITKREALKIVWKDYIPAVGVQLVTITCVVGAQSINLRKQTALISVATVSEAAFREYQERMSVEVPTKDRKVRDDIARDAVSDNPVNGREVVIVGNGDQLFYERHTDRYFMSTMHDVRKAVNDLNFRVLNQEYASLNEFYNMVGLKTIPQGEEFGWTSEHPLELDYSTQMTEDDRACVVIDYVRKPLGNYWKVFR